MTNNAYLLVVARDAAANEGSDLSNASFRIIGSTGVGPTAATEFLLGPVTPNPSRGPTRFEYAVPSESDVRFSIVDVQGREVALLASGRHVPGRYEVRWNGGLQGGNVAAGVYFARLDAGGQHLVRRFVLNR